MRLSAVEGDPGFTLDAFAVYVDGARVSLCHTADDAEGVAWLFATDRDGMPITHGGRFYEVPVRGRVELRPL